MREERQKVWIHAFQTRIFIRVCAYGLVCLVTLWNLLFVCRLLLEGPGDLPEQYVRFMKEYYPPLLIFLLLLPVAAWDAVKVSHRVVGPLVRIRHGLQQLAAGQPVQPVRFREGDYLLELRDDFNAMLNALGGPRGGGGEAGGSRRRGFTAERRLKRPLEPLPEIVTDASPPRQPEADIAPRGSSQGTLQRDGFPFAGAPARPAPRTSMEYLVMLSFILLVVIIGVQSFGGSVAALFKVDVNATSQNPGP